MAAPQNALQRERAKVVALEKQLSASRADAAAAAMRALWAEDESYRARRRRRMVVVEEPSKPRVPFRSPRAAKPLPSGMKALKAVTDSAAVSAWYRMRLQRLVREMARSMLLHVRAAWKRADPDIAADESPTVTLKRALSKWGTRWTRRLNLASKALAKEFAERSGRDYDERLQKILRDAGWTVEFRPTERMKEAYRTVIAEQVNLIRSIPAKFLKDVESTVWTGVMRGGDMEHISKQIQHNYGVSYRRAAFIARDQESKARAVMERARRVELGIKQAVWRHSHAGKTPRPSHVRMDGKAYDIEKGMWDPDVGRFVMPGELPNCRCSSRAIIP